MGIIDSMRAYHASHDCAPGKCVCKCGCTVFLGCTALGGLCSTCHAQYIRDNEDHGFIEANDPLRGG